MRFYNIKIKIDKPSIEKRLAIDPELIKQILDQSEDFGEYIEIKQGKLVDILKNRKPPPRN